MNRIRAKFQEQFNIIIERPLLTASLVLAGVSVLVISLSLKYYIRDFESVWSQILIEAHGMIFDIAIIGILLFWLNQNGETRQRIRYYKDEIDDFRLWESDEAAFRTVGNIKRLNRHKIHEINLVNCYCRLATNLNYVDLKRSQSQFGQLF
ncbi:MAG: hypothetical protein U5K54_13185 [Cytophagales bacterium]|nr:hypothetical protein [Cytophagales bacterium]